MNTHLVCPLRPPAPVLVLVLVSTGVTSSSRQLLVDLNDPAPDYGEDQTDEQEEADGDPVLQRGPVVRDDDPEVFDGETEGEETPGDQETLAGLQTADHQQDRAHHSAGSIEYRVLRGEHWEALTGHFTSPL